MIQSSRKNENEARVREIIDQITENFRTDESDIEYEAKIKEIDGSIKRCHELLVECIKYEEYLRNRKIPNT